ncbi:PTS transporter subunit IIC [Staphylococcus massiliensis]|uniref:Phosphotransferase system EIIC domain-containing protein n=1 Tax=Staphylococcus massiliensis S46 TaxID=1229783 RepID=K9ASK4_9STAP|nr:PTS sugar transporter subunit IIC [Staphylococcus massiliensis]EKU49056.1 hypothetical protein C273_04605 [Staphylococcus massiliensis S46]
MKKVLNRWFIDGLNFMALGLFSSLIIGLIMDTIGSQTLIQAIDITFLSEIGKVAMKFAGAAIGGAIAYGLGASPLVIFSSIIVGTLGYDTFKGGPVGAYIATLVTVELSRFFAGKTKIDIILTPFLTLIIGGLIAKFVGPILSSLMKSLGNVIIMATEQQPFIMGILIAVIFGLCLTAPISSAALALMLDLSGLAAGAATIGCAAQMVGFAVTSYKDNGISELVSLGIGTSMLQVPNIIKHPFIIVPPTLASAIVAPIMTLFFPMMNNAAGAGMGTSGLVGPIMTVKVMGGTIETWLLIIVFYVALPAVLSYVIYTFMSKKGLINAGDQRIHVGKASEK